MTRTRTPHLNNFFTLKIEAVNSIEMLVMRNHIPDERALS
jgi:hypothetical protein